MERGDNLSCIYCGSDLIFFDYENKSYCCCECGKHFNFKDGENNV